MQNDLIQQASALKGELKDQSSANQAANMAKATLEVRAHSCLVAGHGKLGVDVLNDSILCRCMCRQS